jgi:hypothetical protein
VMMRMLTALLRAQALDLALKQPDFQAVADKVGLAAALGLRCRGGLGRA